MQGNSFNYKYSAPTEKERREIESIRRQYIADGSEEGKLARLKKLHKGIKRDATLPSVLMGVLGTLLFGGGLSLVLEFNILPVGITLSAVGIVFMVLSYPLYNFIFNRKKKKHREEIIRLSNELLG